MSSTTRSIINALRVLDSEIQSEDGVANAVVAEAATRLEEQQERIKRLEEELSDAYSEIREHHSEVYGVFNYVVLQRAKEAKP